MVSAGSLKRVAFLGTFPPRKCGIGTFTADVSKAIAERLPNAECQVLALHQGSEALEYPQQVRFQIQENDPEDYRRAAMFLQINDFDVLNVQHEFGIFGGPDGSMLLDLMEPLKIPVITTFHTVLREPTPGQARLTREISALSSRLVVLSCKAQSILREIYDIPKEKIDVVPHGIPDLPFIDPDFDKSEFGNIGRKVLLTFGLMSPGKGIEVAIKAMPRIVEHDPNVRYIVLGATHPNVLREHGESYREMLQDLVRDLGMQDHVEFINEFVELDKLIRHIGASDIYLTPYLGREQISSGTLAYAVGLGKAVVSTPYWYAEELLADGRGLLVPFRDHEKLADAVIKLMDDDDYRLQLRKNAYSHSRNMVWRSVAEQHVDIFVRARQRGRFIRHSEMLAQHQETRVLQAVDLRHVRRLTDHTGILSSAIFAMPNYDEGYTTDDNAKALALMSLVPHDRAAPDPATVERLISTYVSYLWHSFDKQRKRFRGKLGYDRRWVTETGSEETHARAIHGVGSLLGSDYPETLEGMAAILWSEALKPTLAFINPRAWAYTILGINSYLQQFRGDRVALQVCEALSKRLRDMYVREADADWKWFEDRLLYCNPILSRAMIVAGKWLDNLELVDIGLESLQWLNDIQTIEDVFVPIGTQGYFSRGGKRAKYNQAPIEADVTVSAALDAYEVTEDSEWLAAASRAFEWFLGRNDLGMPLYDLETGGCCDSLESDRISKNQGADATLAYLVSHQLMSRVLRDLPMVEGEAMAVIAEVE